MDNLKASMRKMATQRENFHQRSSMKPNLASALELPSVDIHKQIINCIKISLEMAKDIQLPIEMFKPNDKSQVVTRSDQQVVKQLFNSLIALNRNLKSDVNNKLKHLRLVSPVDLFFNSYICQISPSSLLDNQFDHEYEYDWKRKFYFNNYVDVMNTVITDPYTRQKIRLNNRQYFENTIGDVSRKVDSVIDTLDIHLLRCILEYGLVDKNKAIMILESLKSYSYRNKQNAMTEVAKKSSTISQRNIDFKKETLSKEVLNLDHKTNKYGGTYLTNYLSEYLVTKDSQISDLINDFTSPLHSYDKTALAEVIILCAFVILDDEFTNDSKQTNGKGFTSLFTDSYECLQKLKFAFFENFFEKSQSGLSNESVPSIKEYLEDDTLADRINRIFTLITNYDSDTFNRSLNLLELTPQLQNFYVANDDHPAIVSGQELAEKFLALNIKLLDGNFSENDDIYESFDEFIEEFHNLETLLKQAVGTDLNKQQYIDFFKYSFTLHNGIFLMLNSLLAMLGDDSTKHKLKIDSLKSGLTSVGLILSSNPIGLRHLYRKKEWGIFKRLTKAIPKQGLVILLKLAQTCWLPISHSAFGTRHIFKLLNTFFYRLSNMTDVDALFLPSNSSKCVEGYLALEFFKQFLINNDSEDDKHRFSKHIQEIIRPFIKDFALKLYSEDPKMEERIRRYKPILLLKDVDELSDIDTIHQDISEQDSSNLALEFLYKTLEVFNESTLYSKSLLSTDVELTTWLSQYFVPGQVQILCEKEYGLSFAKELIKLYTRSQLMEFNIDKSQFADYSKTSIRSSEEYIHKCSDEICDIIETITKFTGQRFTADSKRINTDYVLEALLPMCYKFIIAVEQEAENTPSNDQSVQNLLESLVDNRSYLMLMIGKEDVISSKGKGMFAKQTTIKLEDKQKLKDSKRKANTPKVKISRHRDVFKRLLEFAESINDVYNSPYEKYSRFISIYRRFDFKRTSNKQGKIEFPILKYLEGCGCLSLSHFKNRFELLYNTSVVDSTSVTRTYSRVDNKYRIVPTSSINMSSSIHKDIHVDTSVYNDVLCNDTILLRISEYRSEKLAFLSKEDSNFYRMLEEGNDKDPDFYYISILDWALQFVVYRFNRNEYSILAKHLKGSKLNNKRESKRDIESSLSDEMLVEDKLIFSWLITLDTIVRIKNVKVKNIMFKRYFDREGDSFESYKDEESESTDNNEIDITNHEKVNLKSIGTDFTLKILESILLFQLNIKREIFCKHHQVHFKYYFVLSSLLKNLTEDNFKHFKLYLGNFDLKTKKTYPDSTKDNSPNNDNRFLHLYFQGLALPDNTPEKIGTDKIVYSDREDLIFYNTVTLYTLAEFFNGPCKDNQNSYVSDITILINSLYKLSEDYNDSRYLLQEAIVRLMSALFEGNNKNKINEANKEVQPMIMYTLVVAYIEQLWHNRHKICSNDSSIISLDTPASSHEIIQNYYLRYQSFASHPSINISNGLLYIMKAIASEKRDYKMFMNEKLESMYRKYGHEGLEIAQQFVKEIMRKEYTFQNNLNSESESMKKLVYYHFINMISATIEVNTETEKNIIIPYQILPMCFFLTNNSKSKFRSKCDISDTSRKLLGLMNYCQSFIIEMQHNIVTYRKSYYLHLVTTEDAFTTMMMIVWSMGLALNVIMIIDWVYKDNKQELIIKGSTWSLITIYILTLMIILLSTIELVLWFTYKYKEVLDKHVHVYRRYRKYTYKISREKQYRRKGIRWVNFNTNVLKSILFEFHPTFFALHLILACLSFYSALYYTLHLFTLVYLSATSRYVIKSISIHYQQLAFTLILVLFVVYNYTVLIAYYFSRSFSPDYALNLDMCDNLKGCLANVLDMGLRLGGGIGDAFISFPFDSPRFSVFTALQLSFFIIVNFILLNMFFGIIADTFKELRMDLQMREEDENDVCFVCGFTRKDFEREEKSFGFHVNYEHNIWNYVYFIAYLKSKNSDDYTGNEYYLKRRYDTRSSDWLPIQKTRFLGKLLFISTK